MKNTKRIISVITALTIVICMFAVMPTALATENNTNYTVNYRDLDNYKNYFYTNETYATEFGDSLLDGKTANAVVYDRDASDNLKTLDPTVAVGGQNVSKLSMLTDGLVEGTDKTNYAQLYYYGGSSAGNVSRLDLEYDLGTVCNINRFMLMGVNFKANSVGDFTYWGKLSIGEFEVYLSNTKEDLYNLENLIYSYSYSDEHRSTFYDVNFITAETGRYFAIRILNPVSVLSTETNPTHIYPRITEIGLFGEEGLVVDATYRDITNYNDTYYDDAALAEEFGTSLIAGKTANAVVYDLDENENPKVLDPTVPVNGQNVSKLSMLTDGKAAGTDKTNYAQLYYYGGASSGNVSRLDLEYDLGTVCNIDRFLLMGVNFKANNVGDFNYWARVSIGEFELYIANDKADLYKPENMVYSYKYSDEHRSTQFDLNFSKPVSGKYVAVRILDCTSVISSETDPIHIYPRISEIGVYGEKVVESGDVNEDGEIDILDAVQLYKHLNDNTFSVANGDVDKSGVVDAADLSALRAILLNK